MCTACQCFDDLTNHSASILVVRTMPSRWVRVWVSLQLGGNCKPCVRVLRKCFDHRTTTAELLVAEMLRGLLTLLTPRAVLALKDCVICIYNSFFPLFEMHRSLCYC